MHPGASDEELRRAYKRQRDLFQSGSLPLVSLLSEPELARERERLEEAQKTLLDGVRRRTYDLSFFPDKVKTSQGEDHSRRADALEQAALQAELAPLLHSETEYTGPLLRKIRESQGIDLSDIAQKTKIATSHLSAIEGEDFATLPAEVYTRGFVSQMVGLLGLDQTHATRSYMRRFRAFRKAQPERRA
jgi:flagellar biosynthesis protein FlhG